jgi:hypothetical protein
MLCCWSATRSAYLCYAVGQQRGAPTYVMLLVNKPRCSCTVDFGVIGGMGGLGY